MRTTFDGVVLWHRSPCRAVLGLMRYIVERHDIPVRVFVSRGLSTERIRMGWHPEEFASLEISPVPDLAQMIQIAQEKRGWIHLVNEYQNNPVLVRAARVCMANHCVVGAFSEAPLNFSTGGKRILKHAYLRFVLPLRVRWFTRSAAFAICLSGDQSAAMARIGWNLRRVVPFGYFPEPLFGATRSMPQANEGFWWRDGLKIVVPGNHEWHRGQDLAVKLAAMLRAKGVEFSMYITGEGKCTPALKKEVRRRSLEQFVRFPGILPLSKLGDAYRTCDVVLGSGRVEPWGIRVNDALNAGARTFVSDGMGVGSYLMRFAPELVFSWDRMETLVDRLRRLSEDSGYRREVDSSVEVARSELCVATRAKEVVGFLADCGSFGESRP